jgi:membrane-bound serine protease (ClpP class)
MVVSLIGTLVFATSGLALAAPSASLATQSAPPLAHVDVIQLTGLIDPVEADFVSHAVHGATRDGAIALVVQLDSSNGVISQSRVDALAATVSSSPVPVAVWVGPNGARAYGPAFAIVRAAALKGVSPGTRVGRAPPPVPATDPNPLANTTLSDSEALSQGVVTINAPTLGDFIVSLDGKSPGRDAQGAPRPVLHTAKVIQLNGEPRRQPTVDTLFRKLSLTAQLLHTAASPSAAYLLLVIGLLLMVLEFFTVGVGIAAFCGAGCLVLASYGFGVLPFRPYALILIILGVLGYAIDLQAGVPRVWTVIGTVGLVIGTVRIYAGVGLSPLAMAVGVIGTALFMIAGMPAMVRARFSTPTIGRESMIGEMGVALGAIEPEGTVEVRGAPWRARTNRATPIALGAHIRVVAIDGLLLEVEPETGGARDARH